MQEPILQKDAVQQALEARATHDNVLLSEDEVTSHNTNNLIATYRWVQKLTANRPNTSDNQRRTKIISGHAKIMALLARFKA